MKTDDKKWTEVSLTLSKALEPLVENHLKSLGSSGNVAEISEFETEEGFNEILLKGYFEGGVESNRKVVKLLELFVSSLRLTCLNESAGEISAIEIKESDWQKWKRFFKPVAVSKRIVIKPSWEHYQKRPHELIVEIDPGMAFGTGTHESTRMCIKMLDNIIAGGESVLDVGTGSGILAISAVKLGAESVFGVDIDKEAVEVAINNVRNNGLSENIKISDVLIGEVKEHFDVVVANIFAEDLILMKEGLIDRLKKGGSLILSGIIKTKTQNVIDAYIEKEMNLIKILDDGEWSAILLTLKK